MNSGGIVCFHGTRSLGGFPSGSVPDTPVDEYVQALGQMERNCGLIFGAVHGYYGAAARSATLKEGGTFLAVIREPVKRVSSIFAANVSPLKSLAERIGHDPDCISPFSPISGPLEEFVTIGLHNLQQRFVRDVAPLSSIGRVARSGARVMDGYRDALTAKRSARQPTLQDLGDAIAALFFGSVHDTICYDTESFRVCSFADLLVMERFTTDVDYYRANIWTRIAGNRLGHIPKPLVNHRINDHVRDKQRELSPEAQFAEWGKAFQKHLIDVSQHHTETVAVYRRVGYFCP